MRCSQMECVCMCVCARACVYMCVRDRQGNKKNHHDAWRYALIGEPFKTCFLFIFYDGFNNFW